MRGVALLFLAIFCLLSLSGCIKARVVAFDNTHKTVTIQGGKRTTAVEYQQAAEEHCHGPATLLAMQETTVGYDLSSGTDARPMLRYNKTFGCDPVKDEWVLLGPTANNPQRQCTAKRT